MTADFNNDGFADLAVGVPAENGVAAVNVLYGTAAGLSGAGGQLFSQVGGAVERGDLFGWAVAAGDFNNNSSADFNNNSSADLAAAAPAEGVGSAFSAGAVSVLDGSGAGLTTSGGRLFTQNRPGIPGVAEPFDQFGGTYLIAG